jgi:hypothetical protein
MPQHIMEISELKDICEEGSHIPQVSLASLEERNFTKRLQPIILKAKLTHSSPCDQHRKVKIFTD